MHTRYLRPLELSRDAPRSVLNITEKHINNGDITARSSASLPRNQVLTGMIYQHSGFGGGLDYVNQGIHSSQLAGVLAAFPDLDTPLAPPYGQTLQGSAWFNYDKRTLCKLARQNTPLGNGPGYLVHVWQGSSFAGSASTVTLRNALDTDVLPAGATRPPPPPPPPPIPRRPDWSARFFYGPTGRPPAPGGAGPTSGGGPAQPPPAQRNYVGAAFSYGGPYVLRTG